MSRFFLLFFLLSNVLHAQQKEYVFTKITKEFRLASTRVNAMVKDRQGYYWIAYDNGLQRFDGRNMMHFWHDDTDTTSLPDNNISRLLVDHNNRLWMNSGGWPCYYQPVHRDFKKASVETKFPSLNIYSFYEDSRKLLWMITSEEGLFVLDTLTNTFRKYSFILPALNGNVFYIGEDTVNHFYWLSTAAGFAVYDIRKKIYYTAKNNPLDLKIFSNPVFTSGSVACYKDQNNILWLQTWEPPKGFNHYRYDINRNELLQITSYSQRFWGWLTDSSGSTWAYGTVLARYDIKTNSFIAIPAKRNSQYGIDYNDIGYMFQDDEKNLWLTSNLGLYYFNPYRQFFSTSTLDFNPLLNLQGDANINNFIETTDGHIIMTKWGGDGLSFFDSELRPSASLYGYNPRASADPNYLLNWCGLQDKQGLIWIGGQHGRIMQLNPATKKTTYLHPKEFEDKTIRSIAEDPSGNIWFGTQNNIIVKWIRNTNSYKQIVPLSTDKYSLGWVIRLLPGYDNDLWAATLTGGLLHIDNTEEKVIEQYLPGKSNLQSISATNVKDIAFLNADTLIVATSKGFDLFEINRKIFSHITTADAPPAEGIMSIIPDDKKNIWYSSADGISRLNIYTRRVKNFGAADGITELDFQPGSVTRLKSGQVVFGNTRGYVSFSPDEITDAGPPGNVVITGFRVFNDNLSVDSLFQNGNQIRLKNPQNYFLIRFASLSNMMKNRPVYYYKLEGADKDWIASTNQEAVYTYLPGGNYTFRVKCISPDGVESNTVTSFKIHIEPPVYQKWWFILLVTAALSAVVYYIFLLRARRRNERELIRNRIARDLHDDMGSTLSTISILSSMARSKLHTDEVKTSEYINKISDNSLRMMEAMDDIVWAIKPDNDSMQKIVARMREFATNVLESKDIELLFHAAPGINDLKLDMEQRRDFFLIFKEAVNNVAKYSKCKKVTIQIGESQGRLALMVKDDGTGFDVNAADSGNGLGNMQKRADALKGRLQVLSKPGEGTQVILNIPVG